MSPYIITARTEPRPPSRYRYVVGPFLSYFFSYARIWVSDATSQIFQGGTGDISFCGRKSPATKKRGPPGDSIRRNSLDDAPALGASWEAALRSFSIHSAAGEECEPSLRIGKRDGREGTPLSIGNFPVIPNGSDPPRLASALLLAGRPPCRPWIATDRTEPVPPNASGLAVLYAPASEIRAKTF